MAIPPSKFFKDLNTSSITPVTNTSTTATAQNPTNTPAALDIPTPSTTPPPAYTRGMPPPGIFHNPYDSRSPFPPPAPLYPAFPMPNSLGLVAAPYANTPNYCVPNGVRVYDGTDNDHDSEAPEAKTIYLHISCPITVKGSNNRVHLSPVVTATKVAQAVVRAIKEASMCQGGVPMIDEDGVPRGVDVKVDAAVTVEGDGNVVGEVQSAREDDSEEGKGKGKEAGREVVVEARVGGKTVIKREREDDEDDGAAGRSESKRMRQS